MASVTTRDHRLVQEWARQHGACPAVVSRTGGMLRFEFDPASAGALREVDWEDFFRVFDDKGLDLIYDDKPGSHFHKLAYPEATRAAKPKTKTSSRAKPATRAKSHHRKAA